MAAAGGRDFHKVDSKAVSELAPQAFPGWSLRNFDVAAHVGPGIGTRRPSVPIAIAYDRQGFVRRQARGAASIPVTRPGTLLLEWRVGGIYQDDGTELAAVPDRPVHNGIWLP